MSYDYTIQCVGHGGEFVAGYISPAAAAFWEFRMESGLAGIYASNAEPDEAVPERFRDRAWHEIDGLMHENGADYHQTTRVDVLRGRDDVAWSSPVTDCSTIVTLSIDDSEVDGLTRGHGPILVTRTIDRGVFNRYLIVLNEPFRPDRLTVSVSRFQDQYFVAGFAYPDVLFDQCDDDISGKGHRSWIIQPSRP